MTADSDGHRSRRLSWRVTTPLVFAVSGALFVVSATSSGGTDLRSGRVTTMAGLVRAESQHAEELQSEANELRGEVDRLAGAVADEAVRKARARAEELQQPAGLTPVSGPGVTVTLSDAPREVRESSDRPVNLLVVHQQDIQAVVNAMWAAGARAITIQGQRIISTTGIKCAGSSVELQGIPYPEPYEITAVGDPEAITAAIDSSRTISNYRAQAEQPDIAIGWELDERDSVVAPAYEGTIGMTYARPVV